MHPGSKAEAMSTSDAEEEQGPDESEVPFQTPVGEAEAVPPGETESHPRRARTLRAAPASRAKAHHK